MNWALEAVRRRLGREKVPPPEFQLVSESFRIGYTILLGAAASDWIIDVEKLAGNPLGFLNLLHTLTLARFSIHVRKRFPFILSSSP
jgi:hypothetical protein